MHIGEQKAYFYKGKTLIGETTVSTGKPGFSTPPGHYTVLSKNADHVSTVFGDYVDEYGNVVRSNIDSRKDRSSKRIPFRWRRMPYAMFFRGGYAMHQGYVPPFAASHGCIRLPGQMAVRFFENAPVGTRGDGNRVAIPGESHGSVLATGLIAACRHASRWETC